MKQKKKYAVSGMHCTSCAMMIEGELEDMGVVAKCSFVKQTVDVEFDPKKTTEEEIKKVIRALGYLLV